MLFALVSVAVKTHLHARTESPPQHTHSGRRWALKLREGGGDRGHWLTYWGFWVNLGFHEESNSFDESGVSL